MKTLTPNSEAFDVWLEKVVSRDVVRDVWLAREAWLAARGVKRAICALPDCGETFELTSKRHRIYCSMRCGQVAATRAFRARESAHAGEN